MKTMKIQEVKPGYRIRVTEDEDVLEFTVDHISANTRIHSEDDISYREYRSTSGSSYEYPNDMEVEVLSVVEPPIGSVVRFNQFEMDDDLIEFTRVYSRLYPSCWVSSIDEKVYLWPDIQVWHGYHHTLLDPSTDL